MVAILSILKNKWFWIILAIIIIIIIINKNWETIESKLFDRKIANYARDAEGNIIKVTELDKPRLNAIADRIRVRSQDHITGGLWAEDLQPALDLTDQELEYTAKYYKTAYNITLYKAVSEAWMPFTQTDQELMARLDKLALK